MLTIAITSNLLLIGDQRTQLVRGALRETCGDCRVLAVIRFLEARAIWPVRCGGSLTWVPSFKFAPSMSPRGVEVYCLTIPLVSGSCEGSRGSPPVGVERSTPPGANRGARWQGCAQLACS